MNPNDFDYPSLQKWTRRSKGVLVFGAIISGIATYPGIKAYTMSGDTGFFHSSLAPLLLTLVSVVVSWFGYSYIYERYPLTKTSEERARLHFIMLFVSGLLLTTSTYFTVLNLAGPTCLNRKLQADLMAAEKAFDEIVAARRNEKQLLMPLSLAEGNSGSLAEGERKGTLSKKDGDGKVVANITAMKKNFGGISSALQSSLDAHENAAIAGQTILSQIRGILNDKDIDVRQKERLVIPLFNDLKGKFATLKISAVPAIVAAVEKIDTTSFVKGAYMETAIEAIKTPIQKTKQSILDQVALVKQEMEPVIPRFYAMDQEQALFAYPEGALQAIVFGVAIDVGIPIFSVFCLFFIGRRETRQQMRGWNHGTNHQIGIAGAGSQVDAGRQSLWTTNNSANRRGDQSRPRSGDRPEPPAA